MLALSLQWFDWWRRAAALSWKHVDALAALNDPRALRGAVLTDWRDLATQYMRTPEFLALMRFNLTLLTQPTLIKAAQMMALPIR
jgi:hypothetical protein